jgi:hypothetical protein
MPTPDGIFVNNETVIFVAGCGILLFLLGCSMSICIHRKYKREKEELIKSLRNGRWRENLEGIEDLDE